MVRDFAVLLAWPETPCKQAGSWYDPLMAFLGYNKNGYYTVGHAAVVLLKHEDGSCHYFDFGRYHAPKGYGRVRNADTDHDLRLLTVIRFGGDGLPMNLDELIDELRVKVACHGAGELHAGVARVDFGRSYLKAKNMQKREFIPYGPFVKGGSNCSRFVRSSVLEGLPLSPEWIGLRFPLMLTPTPLWNTVVTKRTMRRVTEKAINYEKGLA